METMSITATKELIKRHEGYRGYVYCDTLGNMTCGWGHLITRGSRIPCEAAHAFFNSDFRAASAIYKSLDLGLENDCARRAAVIDLCFNLGNGIKDFTDFIKLMREKKYAEAATALKDSRWRRQVKTRATTITKMIETGRWPDWINIPK